MYKNVTNLVRNGQDATRGAAAHQSGVNTHAALQWCGPWSLAMVVLGLAGLGLAARALALAAGWP